MQKGFTPIIILVGILVVLGVVGGAYYLGRQIPPKPLPISQPTSSVSPNVTPVPTGDQASAAKYEKLIAKAKSQGSIRVIVELNIPWKPEGDLPDSQSIDAQQQSISQAQDKLLQELLSYNVTSVTRFKYTPGIAFEVNEAGLEFLVSSTEVKSITEDIPLSPL